MSTSYRAKVIRRGLSTDSTLDRASWCARINEVMAAIPEDASDHPCSPQSRVASAMGSRVGAGSVTIRAYRENPDVK